MILTQAVWLHQCNVESVMVTAKTSQSITRPLQDNVQQKSSTTVDHRQIRTPSKSPVTNIFDIDMGGIDDDDDFDFTSTLQCRWIISGSFSSKLC